MWPIAIVGTFVLLLVVTLTLREARRTPPQRISVWTRAPVCALLLWAPYVWLLLLTGVDETYRLFWIERWPMLPGLPAIIIARAALPVGESTEWWLAGAMALVLFALAIGLSSIGPRAFLAVVTSLVAYGVTMGFVSHALFVF